MLVRDVMTRNPEVCLSVAPIEAVARMMVEHDCGAIPVVGEDRKPIGIVTDRDIVARTIAQGIDPMSATASQCMSAPPLTVDETMPLSDLVHLLETAQIRRALVVDSFGTLRGIVAQADIARHASRWRAGDLVRELSKPSVPVFTR